LIVYVSSPYTNGDTGENVRRACLTGDALLEMGHIPLIPHLTHFWHFISPKSWDDWMKIDLALLARVDCVLRLDGESKGGDLEVKVARKLGIPVYSWGEIKAVG